MNFFGKKDDSLNEERLKLTKIYLSQQKEENSELRKELAGLQELVLRNKLLLNDLLHSVSANEKVVRQINESNAGFEKCLGANEEMILKLEDEIKQLKGVKNTYIASDFFLSGDGVQGILEKAFENGEVVCFRDLNGEIWKIEKKKDEVEGGEDEEEEEGGENIEEFSISIKLSD